MSNADFLTAINLVVTVALALWAIYQTRLTHRLEGELHRLSVALDQDLQRLHRAREALIGYHTNYSYYVMMATKKNKTPDELQMQMSIYAVGMARRSELLGILKTLKNQQLQELVASIPTYKEGADFGNFSITLNEVITKIHATLTELIAEATKRTN